MAGAILRLRAAAAAGGRRHLASSSPCLMLQSNKMYCLRDTKVVNMNIEKELEWDYVVGSSHGWVGLAKEEEDRVRCGNSSSLSLWNPMSGSQVMLPPIHTLPGCIPTRGLDVKKLVVDDEDANIIVAEFPHSLAVCGCSSSEWSLFGVAKKYLDVVACSGSKLYSFNRNDEMVRWDIRDPRRPRLEWEKSLYELGYDADDDEKKNFPRKPPHHDHDTCTHEHLVYAEHSGQLFLVFRHSVALSMKTVAFDVRLLVENKRELRYMEHSLDGLVMFLGINNSFAVPAADFPHLNPNSIYFADHADIGIYDYERRTISSCYYPSHSHHWFKGTRPDPFWLKG